MRMNFTDFLAVAPFSQAAAATAASTHPDNNFTLNWCLSFHQARFPLTFEQGLPGARYLSFEGRKFGINIKLH